MRKEYLVKDFPEDFNVPIDFVYKYLRKNKSLGGVNRGVKPIRMTPDAAAKIARAYKPRKRAIKRKAVSQPEGTVFEPDIESLQLPRIVNMSVNPFNPTLANYLFLVVSIAVGVIVGLLVIFNLFI